MVKLDRFAWTFLPSRYLMPVRLIIEDDEGSTTIVPLSSEAITIGRESGNTIQLTEKNVSRRHARLYPDSEADGWFIQDLGSYNGVKVNGEPIQRETRLQEGDVVQIGDYHLALTEDLEKRTLEVDGAQEQAANEEPLLASSSTQLPRLTREDLDALQSNGAANDEPAEAPPAPSSPGEDAGERSPERDAVPARPTEPAPAVSPGSPASEEHDPAVDVRAPSLAEHDDPLGDADKPKQGAAWIAGVGIVLGLAVAGYLVFRSNVGRSPDRAEEDPPVGAAPVLPPAAPGAEPEPEGEPGAGSAVPGTPESDAAAPGTESPVPAAAPEDTHDALPVEEEEEDADADAPPKRDPAPKSDAPRERDPANPSTASGRTTRAAEPRDPDAESPRPDSAPSDAVAPAPAAVEATGGAAPAETADPPSDAPEDPEALLDEARMQQFKNPKEAYELAKRAYGLEKSQGALVVMASAACRMGDSAKAKQAVGRLRGDAKEKMKSACEKQGIEF